MSDDWDVARWPGWLSHARLVADLVTVAAGLSVAQVLWGLLTVTDGKAPAPAARGSRRLAAFAALLALCGASYLAVVLVGRAPTPVGPVALKGVVAVLWVVTAVRFRSFAAVAPAPAAACPACASLDAERIEAKIRLLEVQSHNETRPPDQSDALGELRDILAELEARQQCQT